MKTAVLGTGMVGQALASRLLELGHDVVVGTRDPEVTLSRTEPDAMGNPPFSAWLEAHPAARLASLADAVTGAELVVNATSGAGALPALEQAGADNLAGKVVLDISNPLDFSQGFPPSLFVKDTDSLGEQLQRAFPQARIVKSLNTLNAGLMVDPKALGEESTVFVAGNDQAAKDAVTELLHSFGHTDVIDLGDITGARGIEMLLPVWLRLMQTLGTASFNFRVVR